MALVVLIIDFDVASCNYTVDELRYTMSDGSQSESGCLGDFNVCEWGIVEFQSDRFLYLAQPATFDENAETNDGLVKTTIIRMGW